MKCSHHENGREGVDAGAGEDSTEREKLANKFRHHPIYRLSLGQVDTITINIYQHWPPSLALGWLQCWPSLPSPSSTTSTSTSTHSMRDFSVEHHLQSRYRSYNHSSPNNHITIVINRAFWVSLQRDGFHRDWEHFSFWLRPWQQFLRSASSQVLFAHLNNV